MKNEKLRGRMLKFENCKKQTALSKVEDLIKSEKLTPYYSLLTLYLRKR